LQDAVVEPYNATLSLCNGKIPKDDPAADMCILLDGNTLLDACYSKKSTPLSSDKGFLIASAMTGVTASLRFPGQVRPAASSITIFHVYNG
jgi:tubulin beta